MQRNRAQPTSPLIGLALLLGATIIFLSIEFMRVAFGWNRIGIRVPMALGFIKDLLDIGVVLWISYGCWPAAAIEISGRLLNVRPFWRVLVCCVAAIIHGMFTTYRGFQDITFEHILTGIVTGGFIYAAIFIFAYTVAAFVLHLSGRN